MPTVREMLASIDREYEERARVVHDEREPLQGPPPVFRRGLRPIQAPPPAAPVEAAAVPVLTPPVDPAVIHATVPEPVPEPSMMPSGPLPDEIEAEAAIPYRVWIRQKSEKYDRRLKCRTTPDFIDLTALNTVSAEFPSTYIEVTREARLWADRVDDQEAEFATWWNQRLVEARALATAEGVKITSDGGVNTFAQARFADEYARRQALIRETKHRAEFLGSLKLVVQNSATVLKGLGPSLAFEMTTAGGLKVRDDPSGIQFLGSPARRIEDKPSPDALLRARRARVEGTP